MRQSELPVTLAAESVVRVPGPPDRIWQLLHDPAFAVAMDPDCIDAWREPGSPIGLGEIQVFVVVIDGVETQLRLKVVAYEEGRRAVTETMAFHVTIMGETVISPDADGDDVDVVQRTWCTLPLGSPQSLVTQVQEDLDTWALEMHTRLPDYCGRPDRDGPSH